MAIEIFHKYGLELVVFASGMILMILELVGSRVLAPYFGTTIVVWTALIGIILLSLSIGYILGGKIADREPHIKILARILFLSAIFIGITSVFKTYLMDLVFKSISDYRLSSVFASIVLFTPGSLLLGMVSPYAVRIKINSLEKAGTTTGNLYAISTLGSIAGTFIGGFYLIAFIDVTKILLLLSVSLFLLSLFLGFKPVKMNLLIFVSIFIIFIYQHNLASLNKNSRHIVYQGDTQYNTVTIFDYLGSNRPMRFMFAGATYSSMYLDDPYMLSSEYTRFYDLVFFFNPKLKSAVMFGGAAYSYPKSFLRNYPTATIDVVEIDPAMANLAKRYFSLFDDPRLKTYNSDGRVFLNNTSKKYDAILGDAFNGYNIPFQLTTIEAINKMHKVLNDNGIVIINLVGSLNNRFIKSEYATFMAVFPRVYVFPLTSNTDFNTLQNIMLVAVKKDENPNWEGINIAPDENLQKIFITQTRNKNLILTDGFAPVDYYMLDLIKNKNLFYNYLTAQ